ncbi:tRNA (guanosine(37)-N1)-methyltransferase TrmD [Magnetofaba australis]|uniref:tRNA (guanine-N(1)-)-methyltransferase n=1 Tax=Magnetofaba australis IT-1 TaxID=1434232 RepID=A0A1Y2K1Y2_9PROT|nr:tRNA (guanosine(37)-N1)-methyltransferase TrmD [Magnetofaba australis]OSM01962.1 putative tRNA (Guanine37-N1) methyltransferase [Magnetofaba australis IT-1]
MSAFTILTLFPEMFAPLEHSILKRARDDGKLALNLIQIRDFATDRHRRVDDAPFGGGPGMVMKPDVLERALDAAVVAQGKGRVIYLSPQGPKFDQATATRLAGEEHLILLCGHYEGLDERFVAQRVDEELSLGDFVLTGGEIPAMAVVDAVARLIPGVLGDAQSAAEDSFVEGLLDHPHYTRPAHWAPLSEEGVESGREEAIIPVPDVLRSGDHGAVAQWRRRQALLRTLIRRPELIGVARLDKHETRLIKALAAALDEWETDREPDAGQAGMRRNED